VARNPSLIVVLSVLSLVALGAGIQGFVMLQKSQKYMKSSLEESSRAGVHSSGEQCVDFTMNWYARCEAMKSLCDGSVGRVMIKCLESQERAGFCASLGDKTRDTHFGYKECQARGVDRWNKKACAETFRTIDRYCERLVHGVKP
jgi:hypothetical protein